ncbi:MAG: DNA translocase FtsK [Phycisphaerales bacterium]
MAQVVDNARARRAVERSRAAAGPEDTSNGAPAVPPSNAARLLWIGGFGAWVFLVISMVSFDPADPPGTAAAPVRDIHQIQNWGRQVGAYLSHELFTVLGSGAWILALTIGGWLLQVAFRGPVRQVVIRGLGVLILAAAFSSFHALLLPTLSSMPQGGGGLVGISVVHELAMRFGLIGTAMWLLFGGFIGATVAFDHYVITVPREMFRRSKPALGLAAGAARFAGGKLMKSGGPGVKPVRENDVDDDRKLRLAGLGVAPDGTIVPAGGGKMKKKPVVVEAIDEEVGGLGGGGSFDPDDEEVLAAGKSRLGEPTYQEDGEEGDEPVADAPAVFSEEALREKIARLPVRFNNADKKSASEGDLDTLRAQRRSEEEADKNYVFPGLDLLSEPEQNFSAEMEVYVREQATALEAAMHQYGIDGEVVGIESGPVITLYQVRLAPGTKVSSIQTVASDIARSLKAVNLRIVPNTEGLDTVGVEVPNRKKEKVRLKELMTASEMTAKMKLPLFLGKDASGNPLIIDLASLPHMLIAGTTGSGKSVCMNAIIMGFLYTQKPSDLKLVLVDPKMVELSQFKDIPHLMCPVVTEMGKAAAILEWAVNKMDERYELLAEAGCRDIGGYNALGWDELKVRFDPQNELEEAKIPRKLPYMVFVIDELADLMMTNKEVESSIVRIAQKARAVGIHLILATQRPQANVVTGLIKSNMPGRIAFKVASGMDSRIVMDQKGGELLLGQGDMLMLTPRSSTAIRAQGTLVDDGEARRVVKFVKEHSAPSFERSLVGIRNSGLGGLGGKVNGNFNTAAPEEAEAKAMAAAQEDPLFDKAVEIVLETRRGSVSLLQRRLAIGYTRASRLIELMGIVGIIGEHKGSVAREVVMSEEEWAAIKELLAREGMTDRDPNLFGAAPGAGPGAAVGIGAAAVGSRSAELDLDDPDAGEDLGTIQPRGTGGPPAELTAPTPKKEAWEAGDTDERAGGTKAGAKPGAKIDTSNDPVHVTTGAAKNWAGAALGASAAATVAVGAGALGLAAKAGAASGTPAASAGSAQESKRVTAATKPVVEDVEDDADDDEEEVVDEVEEIDEGEEEVVDEVEDEEEVAVEDAVGESDEDEEESEAEPEAAADDGEEDAGGEAVAEDDEYEYVEVEEYVEVDDDGTEEGAAVDEADDDEEPPKPTVRGLNHRSKA